MDLAAIFAPATNSHIPNRYLYPSIHGNPSVTTGPFNDNPTSKSAIELLESVTVNSSFLEKEPIKCCLICENEFKLDMEVKILPCKHVYHSECIVQWLEMKNTCLVCKFQLPSQEDEDYDFLGLPRDDNFIGTIISEELLDVQEESEEEFVHLESPLGPDSFSRNLAMVDSWITDITIMSYPSQDMDLLYLTSIRASLSEYLDDLFFRFCDFSQMVVEIEIESLLVLPVVVHIQESGLGVDLIGMANMRRAWWCISEWDLM